MNAGSMADIAFLLLIFFLITTTMETDGGVLEQLPPEGNPPPTQVHDRNIFSVESNAIDETMIEKELVTLEDVEQLTREFFTNPSDNENLPVMKLVTEDSCLRAIEKYETAIASGDSAWNLHGKLKKARQILQTVQLIGPYRGIHHQAMVVIQHDPKTSYRHHIQTRQRVTLAVMKLRDELCMEHFKVPYNSLDKYNSEHHAMLIAARTVYPKRISEINPELN